MVAFTWQPLANHAVLWFMDLRLDARGWPAVEKPASLKRPSRKKGPGGLTAAAVSSAMASAVTGSTVMSATRVTGGSP
jgi:hypothetical protein